MQYAIERRELSNGTALHTLELEQAIVVIAQDPHDAIEKYAHDLEAVLLTFMQPHAGRESIGIVGKENRVFLIRVYEV